MGPFELMDLIGHDVELRGHLFGVRCLFRRQAFYPSLIQQELVQAGRLGRRAAAASTTIATRRADRSRQARRHGRARRRSPWSVGLAWRPASSAASRPQGSRCSAGPAGVPASSRWARPGWRSRTAAARRVDAHEEAIADLVLFDLAADFAATPRIAVAIADQCGSGAAQLVVGTLQQAGMEVSRIDDVAGMVALRTVAMLANEAADAVLQGIGSARDIDTAMRYGTNYPKGRLPGRTSSIGVGLVASVLANLRDHYGEERYRVSPLIQRKHSPERIFMVRQHKCSIPRPLPRRCAMACSPTTRRPRGSAWRSGGRAGLREDQHGGACRHAQRLRHHPWRLRHHPGRFGLRLSCNSYNEQTVASGISVDFIAPAREGDVLTAEATEVALSGRTGVYDVKVTNQRGDTIAVMRGKSYRLKGRVVVPQ